MKKLSEMAKEAISKSRKDGLDLSKVILEMTAKVESRFEREIPKLQGIRRKQGWDHLDGEPFGRILAIKGVPKIGKTSWVVQLCNHHLDSSDEVIWLDAPDPLDEREFHAEFCRILLSRLLNAEAANDFSNRRLSESSLRSKLIGSKLANKLLVVIDEAGRLGEDVSVGIARFLSLVTSSAEFDKLGILFITNKSLRTTISCLNQEYTASEWSPEEFEELLDFNNIKVEGNVQEYSQLLFSFSGGHPLVALALARKATNRAKLLTESLQKKPELSDEDFSKEIDNLLFSNLLPNEEYRTFVFRHSTLFHRFNEELMDVIASEVHPPLQIMTRRILEELDGTIIEGSQTIGYQISPVFKSAALKYVSKMDRDRVHEKVCDYLLTPRNKVINVDEVLNGLLYALALQRFQSMFAWTILLLQNALERDIEPTQLEYLLERLVIVEAVNPPEGYEDLGFWMVAKTQIATAYMRLNNPMRANGILSQISEQPIPETEAGLDIPISLRGLQNLARIRLLSNSALLNDSHDAIRVLNDLNLKDFPATPNTPEFELDIITVAGSLIHLNKAEDFPKDFLARVTSTTEISDQRRLKILSGCFLNLGVVAGEDESIMIEDLTSSILEGVDEPIWPILASLTTAQYLLEIGDWEQSLQELMQVIKEAEEVGLSPGGFTGNIYVLVGDAFYRGEQYSEALRNYQIVLSQLSEDDADFDHGWCNFRMGMSTEDLEEAIRHLEKASQIFEKLSLYLRRAEAEGEKATVYYLAGERGKAVTVIEKLAQEYYEEERTENGPAVAIGMAMLNRMVAELTGALLVDTEELVYPGFQRRTFTRVAGELTPDSDYRIALFVISKAFGAINLRAEQVRLLDQSLKNRPMTSLGTDSEIIIAGELISQRTIIEEYEKASELAIQLLSYPSVKEKGLESWSYFAVRANAALVASGDMTRPSFLRLLASIESQVSDLNERDKCWCLTEIHYGRAGIDDLDPEEQFDANSLRKAWQYAQECGNFNRLISIAHKLGFVLAEETTSFHELVAVQLSLILATCQDESTIGSLKTVGHNLLNLWSVIGYRRIAESELIYMRNLRYRAKRLVERNTSKELAAPLMVLFLIVVKGESDNPEFEPAIKWARSEIENKQSEISIEDLEYIKDCFDTD